MTWRARAGWVLFFAGCVVFTVQGLAAGDGLTTLGGALFTIGCILMLVDGRRRPG